MDMKKIYIFSFQDLRQYKINQLLIQMFRLNYVDPDKNSINVKVRKIKSLLSQTLASVKSGNDSIFENQDSPLRKSKDSSTEAEGIEEILSKLQQGYLMVKHSRNTNEPHNKFVYLSQDNRNLCWKSMDKQDEKKFPLSSIIKISKKGCKSALRNRKELNQLSRTLVIFSTERNLELEAATEFESEAFRYEITRAIKHSHEMNQNYPYNLD